MNYKEICLDIIENYPEYSSEYLQCVHYGDYKTKMEFIIENPMCASSHDEQFLKFSIGDDPTCSHTFDDMANALSKMCHIHIDTPYGFYNWNPYDAGTYDAEILDAVMQMTFLNDVIYG